MSLFQNLSEIWQTMFVLLHEKLTPVLVSLLGDKYNPDEHFIFVLGVFGAILAFVSLSLLTSVVKFTRGSSSTKGAKINAKDSVFQDVYTYLPSWEKDELPKIPSTDAIWEIGISKRAITIAEEATVRTIFLYPVDGSPVDTIHLFTAKQIYAVLLKAIVSPDYEGTIHKQKKPSLVLFLDSALPFVSDSVISSVSSLCSKLTSGDSSIRVSTYAAIPKSDLETIINRRRQNQFKEEKEKAKQAAQSAQKVEMLPQPNRACIKCQKDIEGKASQCSACKAVIYCSVDCAKKDWPAHKQICPVFKKHVARLESEKLHDLPFTFYNSKKVLCSYNQINALIERGLHNVGIYKRLCQCYTNIGFGLLWYEGMTAVKAANGSKRDIFDLMGLPDEMFPLSQPPRSLKASESGSLKYEVKSWKELYEAMGWNMDNVAALVLHYPMTVYYLVNEFILKKAKTLKDGERRRITIHLIGVEQEADLLPLFEILLAFYVKTDFCIHFIGPKIAAEIPPPDRAIGFRSEANDSSIFMTLTTCLYTASHAEGKEFQIPDDVPEEIRKGRNLGDGKPDLVIALNPSLLQHQEWVPVVQHFGSIESPADVPIVFTEGLEQMIEGTEANLPNIGCKLTLGTRVNPFRQPVYAFNPAVNLPAWANAFIFGMGKI